MAATEDRPLDLTPTERALLEDMLTRRGITGPAVRLEIEFVRGEAIGGWAHLKFGARPDEGGTP